MSIIKSESNFGEYHEELLDPLGQVAEKEMKQFAFSHPAIEDNV